MKTLCLLVSIPIFAFILAACSSDSSPGHLDLTGPYLGQLPPPDMPEPFAAGVVCTGMLTRDMAITGWQGILFHVWSRFQRTG